MDRTVVERISRFVDMDAILNYSSGCDLVNGGAPHLNANSAETTTIPILENRYQDAEQLNWR